MKEEYLRRIQDLTKQCNDISLLDLVYQLLYKSNRQLNIADMAKREA